MAYFWVQQWVALPLIAEEQMGDASGDGGYPPYDTTRAGLIQSESHLPGKPSTGSVRNPSLADSRSSNSNAPFYSQYSAIPQLQQRLDIPRPSIQQSAAPANVSPGLDQAGSSFNMGAIAGTLPDYSSVPSNHSAQQPQQQQLPRPLSGASTPALVYQLQQSLQYSSQAAANYTSNATYPPSYSQSNYPPAFFSGQGSHVGSYAPFNQTQRLPGPSPTQQTFQGFPQQVSQYFYYPYGPQGQLSHPVLAQAAQQVGSYGRRSASSMGQGMLPSQGLDGGLLGASMPPASRMMPGSGGLGDYAGSAGLQGLRRQDSEASLNSVPRGPPRKPKQSGHALWVGNLPPGTTVVDLKDHFSRDATKDIESLFLISKSNCAFVNYRTEASCAAAMHRFHDSRFHGVRLVCRLRRSSAPASGVPTGPSAMTGGRNPSVSPQRSPTLPQDEDATDSANKPVQSLVDGERAHPPKVAEKFFIVKSLTLQDLELSVRNGIWATQAHNEETLNKAFEAADNVYLIFSANKSGEYFGYARMTSAISDDATEILSTLPETDTADSGDGPKSIPTPATEFAPKGRIIDDSARGTIFWEAELSDEEGEAPMPVVEAVAPPVKSEGSTAAPTWGKPFKIEWISTNRLPFYRTRGLRNPWNANREVKIARDGTELETSVGKRLLQMFHRLGPSSAGVPGIPSTQMPPQIPLY